MLREKLAGRTEALEDLAIELFARELSTRDMKDALTDEAGGQAVKELDISMLAVASRQLPR